MDASTISQLNNINRAFYAAVADDFDQTRGTAWPGWQRLLPHLTAPLSVLDVGCGNARFALFLHDTLRLPDSPSSPAEAYITYHGIDSNPALLEHARTALAGQVGLNAALTEQDIIETPVEAGEYDLVVLFGVLHHIPGYSHRQAFMRRLAASVKSGGLLVFAAWRFYEYQRFRERITAWPDDLQIEPNDYLLDWRRGEVSLRYCHYTDDAEHEALIAATGLTEIETYRADGLGGTANRYSVLKSLRK